MIPAMPARWSRRSVLGLGVAGALTLVSGCSDDGPPEQTGRTDPPPTPSQAPPRPEVPDVPALQAALDRTRTLREHARSIDHPDPRRAARLEEAVRNLGEQERVLEEVLAAGRVPVPSATAPATSREDPPATAAPDGTAAPGGTAATAAPGDDAATTSVGAAERAARAEERARQAERAVRLLIADVAEDVSPTVLEGLSEVSPANLAMLTSLAGQRGALAMSLGGDPRWPALSGPAGAEAAAMLPTFQAAVYAMEVIAARSSGEARETPERALRRLQALTRDLTSLAGPAAAPAPLGYGLEADISTKEGRDALAREVLLALPPTVVAAAGAHTGDLDAVAGTVRLLAEVVELGSWWGLEIGPFPGMTLP